MLTAIFYFILPPDIAIAPIACNISIARYVIISALDLGYQNKIINLRCFDIYKISLCTALGTIGIVPYASNVNASKMEFMRG